MKLRKRARRETTLDFDATKVFQVSRKDLDFNLDREVALYRGKKGEAGNRRPIGLGPRTDYESYFF